MRHIALTVIDDSLNHPIVDKVWPLSEWEKIEDPAFYSSVNHIELKSKSMKQLSFSFDREGAVDESDFFVGRRAGLVSTRLLEWILPYSDTCFRFWPAHLEGDPSKLLYAMIPVGAIDCLDRQNSLVEYITDSVQLVRKYAFRKELIPEICMFRIPGDGNLFFTDTLVRKLIANHVRGLSFCNTEWNQFDFAGRKWDPSW